MTIVLIGVSPPDLNCPPAPFEKPSSSAVIHYNKGLKTPGYYSYLVKITGQDVDKLTFRGVTLADPTKDFGPDPANNATDYSVDLGQVQYVYSDSPSLYAGANGTNVYGILLLTEQYTHDRDTNARLAAAHTKDDPKWPAGAGIFDQLDRLRKLTLSLPQALGLTPEQKAKFNALLAAL